LFQAKSELVGVVRVSECEDEVKRQLMEANWMSRVSPEKVSWVLFTFHPLQPCIKKAAKPLDQCKSVWKPEKF
jgi:hypothetical protein